MTRRLELDCAMNMGEKLPDGDADGEINDDQLLMVKRVAAERSRGVIRIGDVIERIIARDNFEWPVLPPARMPAPPTLQSAGPIGLNAHLPPLRRRVDSSDEDELERPDWPPRYPQLDFDDGDYEQKENTEPQPVRRRQSARRRANLFIDDKAGVDGDASGEEGTNDENDDIYGFIVADDVEYEIIYHLVQFIKYFIV